MSNAFPYRIRKATINDMGELFSLVKKLADYEKLSHEVVATEKSYRKHGFGPEKRFEAFLVENQEHALPLYIGFAIYFFTFSTFTGKPTLYLEDVFVLPEYRGTGIGKALLVELARVATEKDCARMEWSVLNWNDPAIQFYKSLGAKPMDEWTVYRLTTSGIKKLADMQQP